VSRTSNPNNVVYLAKINETTGLVQDIASNSYSEYISNFTYTVDPDSNIFYYTSASNLIGIDIFTGQLVTDLPISTSLQPYFQNFIYNEVTQELIGLERGTNGGNQVFLSKINPQTGVVTPISQNSITDVFSLNGGTTIDLNNQWFQFVSNGKLLSVDISTGQVVHSPTIDTSQAPYFDNILFNAADGYLYGLGRNSSPAEVFLGQIDPITGNVTFISQQSVSTGFSLSGAAINPFAEVYYFSGINEFIGVDLNSGDIFTATPYDFSQSNGDYFDYYYFSSKVTSLLSNQDFAVNISIQIFPNPFEEILPIKADGLSEIKIFDVYGKQVSKIDLKNENQTNFDLSALESGLYFLKLTLNGQISVKKVIKR
jgi:hypothetical protein